MLKWELEAGRGDMGVAGAGQQRAAEGAVGEKLLLGVGRPLFVLGGYVVGELMPSGCWSREQVRNKPGCGSNVGHHRRCPSSHTSA